jgi:UDP-2,3-diacylglucosamine pyrophosphatase LpxH
MAGQKKEKDKQWLERYEDLKKYKEVHGDTNVPRLKEAHMTGLAKWVEAKRRNISFSWNFTMFRTHLMKKERKAEYLL